MATVAERVAAVVAPVVDDLGLLLYDIEHQGSAVRVLVDREGGVDIDVTEPMFDQVFEAARRELRNDTGEPGFAVRLPSR